MSSDFWSGIIVALVVGVIANLITPITRAALLALFVRVGNGMSALGTWGFQRALINSEKELLELDEYHSNPGKFSVLATYVVSFNLTILWAIAIALGFAIFGGWVPSRSASNGFFGLLGASTSTIGHLLILQKVSEHLRSYEKYRLRVLKRIDVLRTAVGKKTGEG